ncbi:RDD family protein [Psychroserpens sp. SPM9]|uniref:RDD family protein n=1 Tax=Psychroserpens sp. SPM9 TaxID=2975598 RepID=UPI0021A51F9F|nr:RDD family protein [Psychroserpens sp. SPM9]MDG5490815.1 RDD family protein [Psychroserpens sp. SPM9]
MNRIEYTVTPDVLASKGIRFANFIIDYIMQVIIGAAIGFAIGILSDMTGNYTVSDAILYSESTLVDFLFGYIVLLIYYTTIETLTGRSIGKFVTNTKVVIYDGSKPSFHEILVRSLCRMIPFEAFSFLGEDGKGWHDSISKTFVVDIKKFEEKKVAFEELDEIGRIGNN